MRLPDWIALLGWLGAAYISHVAREATPEILPVKMADRICNTLDFHKCEEIQRALAYLGYADEVFEMTGVTKYSAKIEETLNDCRKLVDKTTLGERVVGFVKRARERIFKEEENVHNQGFVCTGSHHD